VEDVRERIERRRAREGAPSRRGVRVVKPEPHLMVLKAEMPPAGGARRRPRPRPAQLVGPRPDRIASWAVALGFLLLAAAMLSAH
jgi:hypothetical protein